MARRSAGHPGDNCLSNAALVPVALVDKIDFTLKDGRQSCSLQIAGNDGGRSLLLCETLNERIPIIKAGDLVAYRIIAHFPESQSNIAMLSIQGFIVAKLEPAWSIDHAVGGLVKRCGRDSLNAVARPIWLSRIHWP
jgi:hypothetical protein